MIKFFSGFVNERLNVLRKGYFAVNGFIAVWNRWNTFYSASSLIYFILICFDFVRYKIMLLA